MTEQQQTIELIERIKQDDGQAFSLLLEQFEPLITGSVGKFCKPPVYQKNDFEDLRQEAVLALYKAAKSFDGAQSKVTFGLYAKICINNRLISAKRHRLRSLNKQGRGVGRPRKRAFEGKEQPPSQKRMSADGVLSAPDLSKCGLTAKEEQVLSLYLKGVSYKETAERLHLTVKSVDNALARAKKKIKEYAGGQRS